MPTAFTEDALTSRIILLPQRDRRRALVICQKSQPPIIFAGVDKILIQFLFVIDTEQLTQNRRQFLVDLRKSLFALFDLVLFKFSLLVGLPITEFAPVH